MMYRAVNFNVTAQHGFEMANSQPDRIDQGMGGYQV